MKYKKLTNDQIKISLDRLTRFKFTKEKYLRVFTDIILSNLIEPKLKKNELIALSSSEIKRFAEIIFNGSVEDIALSGRRGQHPLTNYLSITDAGEVNVINKKLLEYENSIFYNDEDTQILLENNLDYESALELIDTESPVNIKWLKSLKKSLNLQEAREKSFLKYPVEKVLLVEGLTEEILLPAFSRFLGHDFYQKGIQVIPAGGKNQVVKMYYKLVEEIKIPIFLLLDSDAEENIRQIMPRLRAIDKIHLVSCGEFEDLLPKSLIIKALNADLANFNSISEADFDNSLQNVANLENIFKTKGLHEFKKADFAKLIRSAISEKTDISPEIVDIVHEIFDKNKTVDTKVCS